MNGFVFSLSALLTFRKNRRDHCQRLLAQVLADEADLVSQREKLIAERDRQFEEIRRLSRRGRVAVEGAAMRRYHSIQLLGSARGIDEKRQLVAQQLLLCRQALSKADAEVKVLERLEEKQRAAFLYHAERRASMSARTLGPPVGCWRNRDDPHALGCLERLLRRRHAVGGARVRVSLVAGTFERTASARNARPSRPAGEGGGRFRH